VTTRKFKVAVAGTARATAVVEIDVPIDWLADVDIETRTQRTAASFPAVKLTDLTEERVNALARLYVDNLASDNGITIDWKIEPVEFTGVLEAQEVK
jgi:hypothetical protein